MADHNMPETELPQKTPQEEDEERKSDPPVRPQQKKQSVAIYLIILFAAAFLLLLMAYFMQQRNSNAIIGNLQDSLSSFQTMEELREENMALRQQLQELEEKNAGLQEENDALNQQYINASNQASQAQAQADLHRSLYVAEYLYENQDYQESAERLLQISNADLDLLGSSPDVGAPSEAKRYETLKAALVEQGYLLEDENGDLTLPD